MSESIQLIKSYGAQVVLVICILAGTLEFFTGSTIIPGLTLAMSNLSNSTVIIGAWTWIVLIVSMWIWNYSNFRKKSLDWQWSIYFMIGLPLTTFFAIIQGSSGIVYVDLSNVFNYMQTAIKAIWYMSFGYVLYRVFRPTGLEAGILSICAIISMFAAVSIGPNVPGLIGINQWIQDWPGKFATSAVTICAGAAMVMISLRTLFGTESFLIKKVREAAGA